MNKYTLFKRYPQANNETQNAKNFISIFSDNVSIRQSFEYPFFNGVSIQLENNGTKPEEIAMRAASAPRIKNMWPVYEYPRPEFNVDIMDVDPKSPMSKRDNKDKPFAPHVMMQVDKMRAKGHTGKGIKIAVIDSGVDYNHPALGGCFGKDCLISFGYDLVGDDYGGGKPPKPDDDPMDCGGHGTHVTGIIAAQKNPLGFTGVAPEATMGHYRVFGCSGGTGGDILMKAAAMAAESGANIITASLGAPGGWTRDGWSELLSRLAKKGIISTVAAGNSGGAGALYSSHTANGANVLSIASYDSTETTSILLASESSTEGGEKVKFGYAAGDPKEWKNMTLPLWTGNFDVTKPDDACKPYPDDTPDLSGHAVLIRRGTCPFTDKAKNAAAKGAKYIIMYNNAPGAFGIGVGEIKEIKAAAMVTPGVGEAWVKSLEGQKKVTVIMAAPDAAERIISVDKNKVTGGALSGFTSWGPTLEMNVKPQFGGPGGNILSTLPLKIGGYGVASGTSMSTPMLAGVVALVQQARGGKVDPIAMRNMLSGTANPQLFNPGNGFEKMLAPVAQQGAGLVQAWDAAYSRTVLEPSSLSFNDTANMPKELEFKIVNNGEEAVEYTISHRAAASVYVLDKEGKWPSAFPNDRAKSSVSLDFDILKIKVEPGKSSSMKASLEDAKDLETKRMPFHSGWIAVNGTDGSALSLPYQYMGVSMNTIATLPSDGSWVANSTDPEYKSLPKGSKFLLPKPGTAKPSDGIPTLFARLALGSPMMKVTLESAKDDKTVAEFLSLDYLTRGTVGFYWDGALGGDKWAPKGDYRVSFKALRINGDKDKADQWDVSKTVDFSIDYKS